MRDRRLLVSTVQCNDSPAHLLDAFEHVPEVSFFRCSPSAPYVATGTMAGAVDLSFSTTACLEVRLVGCSARLCNAASV